eukprot:601084-Heterocapsa_arctica.AAC.1
MQLSPLAQTHPHWACEASPAAERPQHQATCSRHSCPFVAVQCSIRCLADNVPVVRCSPHHRAQGRRLKNPEAAPAALGQKQQLSLFECVCIWQVRHPHGGCTLPRRCTSWGTK